MFHATGVLGTWIAASVGMWAAVEWRNAYLVGILPALLTLWVRASIREPERWAETKASGARMGSFRELFGQPIWRKRALLGMALAAVGLGTFWGVCVATQDLTRELLVRLGVPAVEAGKKAMFAFGVIQVIGAGLGQLGFGPICARFGRKTTFAAFHLLSFLVVPAVCYLPRSYEMMLVLLPIFGFLTYASHAGYAIYFPELFPNHLRATGSSFCFNAGRLAAVPVLLLSCRLKQAIDLRDAVAWLGCFFSSVSLSCASCRKRKTGSCRSDREICWNLPGKLLTWNAIIRPILGFLAACEEGRAARLPILRVSTTSFAVSSANSSAKPLPSLSNSPLEAEELPREPGSTWPELLVQVPRFAPIQRRFCG